MFNPNSEVDFNELEKNAVNAGLCSFEEYSKNPTKWREKFLGRHDETLSMLDNGSKRLGNAINKIEYHFLNYKMKTTEELERVCRENGFDPNKLVMLPEFKNCVAGKGDLVIRMVTKEQYDKRKNWS